MIRRIFDMITIAFNPNYWLMNYKYCDVWDKKLNKLMNENEFVMYDMRYTCELGDSVIWVSNHPYASFIEYNTFNKEVRASRLTIIKANRKFNYDIKSIEDKRDIRLNKLIK